MNAVRFIRNPYLPWAFVKGAIGKEPAGGGDRVRANVKLERSLDRTPETRFFAKTRFLNSALVQRYPRGHRCLCRDILNLVPASE